FVGDWSADMGDHVKKGQVLATIETPDNDSKLAAANARLKADQAIVEARKSDVDFNASQLKRWNESPKGVVSDQEREAKKAAYDTSVARLNEA
ncbi:biotin/lipoyl-binding protein, partial [Acinetobacter baumannii]